MSNPDPAANGWADRTARAAVGAHAALTAAGVAPSGLAELVPAGRRLLVFPRPMSMRPIGEVWRLGTLLLDTYGRLYAAGSATRASERLRPNHQSVSREQRRDIAAAALRGGYPAGTPVEYAAELLPSTDAGLLALGDDAPVGVHEGELRVRWRAGAPLDGAPTIDRYLDERVALLIDPPLRST
ncbi:MAG: hypothetical protein KDB25_10415 [Leucobacter sp.]|nr:hypothetical protein [Leucobacter sp.]